MGWREMKNHTSGCYICLTDIFGHIYKNKHSIKYPNLASTLRPVAHSPELSVPLKPESQTLRMMQRWIWVTKNGSRNQDNPHLIYEAELCDLL
jgi:hypothetical protein